MGMRKILLLCLFLFCGTAIAQWQPSKVVKVIVPFPPGGGVDATFRKIEKFAVTKGVNFVAEYQPGAEGVVGMNSAVTAPKDGNTLIITTTEVAASKDHPGKRFNSLNDFDYITGIRSSIFYLVTNDNDKNIFGFNAPTQKDLITEYIEEQKVKDFLLVPYKGAGQMITDLLNGTISKIMVPGVLISKHIDSGKVKLVKKVVSTGEFVIMVPKGIDPEARKFWDNFFKSYLDSSQSKIDAEEDLTVPRTFSSERVRKIVEKQL